MVRNASALVAGAMLASSIALIPVPARADDAAVAANQLLAAQLLDAATTNVLLAKPNTFERDPIARPFTRSAGEELAFALLTNAVVRVLFRHSPTTVRVYTALEVYTVVNNVRVIER